jgi:excisionase family DNA binding protein
MRETDSTRTGDSPLMSVEELAVYLKVPKSWVYGQTRLASRTGFPVVKVGKYCRFDRQQVMDWLAKRAD